MCFDFDDTHLKTIIHPAGPVASALFALAEYTTGQRRRAAARVHPGRRSRMPHRQRRLSRALRRRLAHHRDRGRVRRGGGVGQAPRPRRAADGLGARHCRHAVRRACARCSAAIAKSFHPGRAAQNGLACGAAREEELHQLQSGDRGQARLRQCHVDEAGLCEITEGLGKSVRGDAELYKPFACGIVIHPSIDGCVQLKTRTRADRRRSREGRADASPHLVLELTGKRTPQVGLEGKFSVFHSSRGRAAVTARQARRNIATPCVRDPKVIALRDRSAADRSMTSCATTKLVSSVTLEGRPRAGQTCRTRHRQPRACR